MQILAIGDVIGKPGRQALDIFLPQIKQEYQADLTIVNAENSAHGIGVTPETAEELLKAGADVLTSGNHVWAHKTILPYLDSEMPLIRPLNYPPGVPGKGYIVKKGVLVVNLIGRTFMDNYDSPFRTMDALLAQLENKPKIIIIDFHAEATSEKIAFGYYVDGKASAVIGTHTHVQTADEKILPGGTAYITDVGMTGPASGVIGIEKNQIIERFLTHMPRKFDVADGKSILSAVVIEADEESGRATGIQRLQLTNP